jgi:hypothetical protein
MWSVLTRFVRRTFRFKKMMEYLWLVQANDHWIVASGSRMATEVLAVTVMCVAIATLIVVCSITCSSLVAASSAACAVADDTASIVFL